MLYLAEVQKPKSGFNISGKSKSELKLLACQRTEQNWSAIPGEELIAGPEEVSNYNPGVLVLVDMNANRQIQSQLRDAGKHLVSILQNLSRQIEKYKKEADEIDSWRQSLSLQSQQLQLRQEEIYGREEELEQTRSELDRLTQEAQALESTLEEHNRSKQELADRWEQLREKEQQLQPGGGGASLSEQQVAEIRTALQHLGSGGGLPPQQLEATVAAIEFQQDLLNQHWDRLHQQQQRVVETQTELDRQEQEIDRRKQQLQELQTALEHTQTEWEVQQHNITLTRLHRRAGHRSGISHRPGSTRPLPRRAKKQKPAKSRRVPVSAASAAHHRQRPGPAGAGAKKTRSRALPLPSLPAAPQEAGWFPQ